jgi:uncharacterized protein (DUF885 family)
VSRDLLVLIGTFFLLTGLAAAAAPATDLQNAAAETERLEQWFEARYEEELDFSPIHKTLLGRKDDYDKIDDMSEAAEDRLLAWRRETVEDLQANFDYQSLTPEARTSWDIWVYQLEQEERALPFRRHGYVFTQMSGPQVFLPQFLITLHAVDQPADMDAYVARISAGARALGQLLERASLAAAGGVRPPRFAYEAVIEQARAVISGAPFEAGDDSPLWADATSKIAALRASDAIDERRAEALRQAARKALLEDLRPAYEDLISWMQADLPNSDEAAAGVWKLPDGQALYAQRLADATTTELDADAVHAFGLKEVERLQGEMDAVRRRVAFTGSLQEFFRYVRESPQFYFPDTDAGREAYLEAAREHLRFIAGRLPDFFGLLPRADLEVRRVEAFREQPGAAQHYMPGSPDGSRPGVYYAHLADMQALPIPELEVVAYHEGNPGHHMQISIAQELTGVPTFRTQAGFTAYSEGWGLYAELLAKEMGAYQDPYSEFGRLSTELWRAIRLVVDAGLHHKRWSEEQAVQYFIDNSPAAEAAIRSEIRRYLVWPGQATAYKIGMQAILALRERARAELGERFDIRAFHDTVLGGGALPLPVLEQRIDAWIARQTASASAPAPAAVDQPKGRVPKAAAFQTSAATSSFIRSISPESSQTPLQ